jgi:hypothetical protein
MALTNVLRNISNKEPIKDGWTAGAWGGGAGAC